MKRKASVALDTGTGNESNQSSSTQDNNSNSTTATNTTTGTNNNHQNGSTNAIVSNNNNNSNNSNSQQQKNKKERADNWSTAEIQVLHRGIETRRDIFYGPPNQATKKNRELAWDAITKEVNSVSTTPRTLSQVMKKFKNEKCRAKRKFIDNDKEGHNENSLSNSVLTNNNTTTNNNNTNMSAQDHTNNNQQQQQLQSQQQQQQQQTHHMTTNETMSSQPSSINVVKLAPQNVAKTMIDLPGHVQQIQMQNDDMVLIVPPEMDGLLSGMNIVSDAALSNQQHNHHNQHTLQAINTGQGLINGTMSNGMMARTIPAGSMCSLVYSTGSEVCGTDHLGNNVVGPNSLASNHINVTNAQNLMHHRGSVEQNQGQHQQQQQHQQQHHHQLHQQQPQQPQLQQQQTHQQPTHQPQSHQTHQPAHHLQTHPHLQQNHHLTSSAAIANSSGAAVESQLKNLLFNLLLKDGQHPASPSMSLLNANYQQQLEYNKQRNDMLAIIANSLNKIEGHLSKISKATNSIFVPNLNINSNDNGTSISNSGSLNSTNQNNNNINNINNNDGNNGSLNITDTVNNVSNMNNQDGTES